VAFERRGRLTERAHEEERGAIRGHDPRSALEDRSHQIALLEAPEERATQLVELDALGHAGADA
jgi:hypothetical protein